MFSVLFEVRPDSDHWDDYLDRAKMLRPELEQIEGFIDNVRYRSLTREGWILSVSVWRDEKALVRWRTSARHHGVQAEGRAELLQDYRLRVGQITDDTDLPAGYELREQRLDESEIGPTTVVLTTNQWAPALLEDQRHQRLPPGWVSTRVPTVWSPGRSSMPCWSPETAS